MRCSILKTLFKNALTKVLLSASCLFYLKNEEMVKAWRSLLWCIKKILGLAIGLWLSDPHCLSRFLQQNLIQMQIKAILISLSWFSRFISMLFFSFFRTCINFGYFSKSVNAFDLFKTWQYWSITSSLFLRNSFHLSSFDKALLLSTAWTISLLSFISDKFVRFDFLFKLILKNWFYVWICR